MCSGGPDSVYLFHQLIQSNLDFEVVHFQHHRRESAEDDAAFVDGLCLANQIKCHRVDLDFSDSRSNFQNEARFKRYAWAKEWCATKKQPLVLTAHHLDDQIETLTMRFERGAGLKGLCGIKPVTTLYGVPLCRPLLSVTKNQILKDLEKNHLDSCHDSSNDSDVYFRNRIRKQVDGAFSIDEKYDLSQKASRLTSISSYFDLRTKIELKRGPVIPKPVFESWPRELQFRITRYWIRQCGFQKQFEYKHFERVLHNQSPIEMGQAVLLIDQTHLVFLPKHQLQNPSQIIWQNPTAKGAYFHGLSQLKYHFKECEFNLNNRKEDLFYFHKRFQGLKLHLTPAAPYETFCAYGHKRPLNLADFFQSKKIGQALRRLWPVLRTENNEIVAVLGLGGSSAYQVESSGDSAILLQSSQPYFFNNS